MRVFGYKLISCSSIFIQTLNYHPLFLKSLKRRSEGSHLLHHLKTHSFLIVLSEMEIWFLISLSESTGPERFPAVGISWPAFWNNMPSPLPFRLNDLLWLIFEGLSLLRPRRQWERVHSENLFQIGMETTFQPSASFPVKNLLTPHIHISPWQKYARVYPKSELQSRVTTVRSLCIISSICLSNSNNS